MDEGSLEQVVIDFWERSYDVLVCTTIIESGIDMPSVNTSSLIERTSWGWVNSTSYAAE